MLLDIKRKIKNKKIYRKDILVMLLDIIADKFNEGSIVIAGIATGIVVALVILLFFVIRYKKRKIKNK